MPNNWESELAAMLGDLLGVQDSFLKLLGKKREMLIAYDTKGLEALAAEEGQLVEALQACVQRREALLGEARREGLPSESIRALSTALPAAEQQRLYPKVALAKSNSRLMQHHSLAHWVAVQRSLLHLSHMLEIIATGGRMKPTYTEEDKSRASGSLIDRAA
jgi:hypothetical protein